MKYTDALTWCREHDATVTYGGKWAVDSCTDSKASYKWSPISLVRISAKWGNGMLHVTADTLEDAVGIASRVMEYPDGVTALENTAPPYATAHPCISSRE